MLIILMCLMTLLNFSLCLSLYMGFMWSDMFRKLQRAWTRNDNATSLLKSVFVTTDKEMESQLSGVSSGQPQLFAEIAQSHDLRALPEQLLPCFFSPVLVGLDRFNHEIPCMIAWDVKNV
jgi:hypothetical protein